MKLSNDIRHGRQCVSALHVHLVFVTKYRRKVFDRDAHERLQAIFEKVCRDFQAQLVEMNGQAEHVHLLINYAPKHSVSSLVNSLKGVSSRLLRSEPPIWRSAIGTMSCGRLPTSPPVVAGHRSALLSNTSSNKRPRSNGPYIPGLKVRSFTARVVNAANSRPRKKREPLRGTETCGGSFHPQGTSESLRGPVRRDNVTDSGSTLLPFPRFRQNRVAY